MGGDEVGQKIRAGAGAALGDLVAHKLGEVPCGGIGSLLDGAVTAERVHLHHIMRPGEKLRHMR
jgi:hypothetical protein